MVSERKMDMLQELEALVRVDELRRNLDNFATKRDRQLAIVRLKAKIASDRWYNS
jgi:hypothetical protein